MYAKNDVTKYIFKCINIRYIFNILFLFHSTRILVKVIFPMTELLKQIRKAIYPNHHFNILS